MRLSYEYLGSDHDNDFGINILKLVFLCRKAICILIMSLNDMLLQFFDSQNMRMLFGNLRSRSSDIPFAMIKICFFDFYMI